MKNQIQDKASLISHFKIDEKCDMGVILGWLPWGDKAFPFHDFENSGMAGGHGSKPKVVQAWSIIFFQSLYRQWQVWPSS